MKIVSFNINSVRARPHQLEHIRDTIDPDVIGLQETKVNDPEFPIEVINEIGYHAEYWGQKGHYGVALLSKEKPLDTTKGFVSDTEEKQNLINTHQVHPTDTGSVEVQVAMLTTRISKLSKHLQGNIHDFSSRQGLLKMIGQRKRLLGYVRNKSEKRYTELIEKLDYLVELE